MHSDGLGRLATASERIRLVQLGLGLSLRLRVLEKLKKCLILCCDL